MNSILKIINGPCLLTEFHDQKYVRLFLQGSVLVRRVIVAEIRISNQLPRLLILNVGQLYKRCGVRIVYRQNLKGYRVPFRVNASLFFKASRPVQCRVSAHRLAVEMVRCTI